MSYGTAEEYHTLEVIRTVFRGPVPMFYVGMGLVVPLIIFLTPFGKKRDGIAFASVLADTYLGKENGAGVGGSDDNGNNDHYRCKSN